MGLSSRRLRSFDTRRGARAVSPLRSPLHCRSQAPAAMPRMRASYLDVRYMNAVQIVDAQAELACIFDMSWLADEVAGVNIGTAALERDVAHGAVVHRKRAFGL